MGIAVTLDLAHIQSGVGTIGKPDTATGSGNFFHDHAVGSIVEIRPAIFAGYGDAEQAHLSEFPPKVIWKGVVEIGLAGQGSHFLITEIFDLLLQSYQFFWKVGDKIVINRGE